MSSVRSFTGSSMWRSRFRCCAGLSDWSNSTSTAPCMCAKVRISSALPLPMNSAASGALRLHVMRATGCIPAVWASSPSSSNSVSKWGRPKSTPTSNTGVMVGEDAEAELKANHPLFALPRSTSEFRHLATTQELLLSASGVSEVEKLTARPGTIVEIACL